MRKFRRVNTITDIDWTKVFRAYEARYDCSIDGAVPQAWWEENYDEIGRRGGACTIYGENVWEHKVFRDEILADLGITLGWEEVREDGRTMS